MKKIWGFNLALINDLVQWLPTNDQGTTSTSSKKKLFIILSNLRASISFYLKVLSELYNIGKHWTCNA